MDKYLSLVTIDVWTLIFTWVNLLILFFIVKKLLFKPIKNILKKREDEIGEMYDSAKSAEENAKKMEEDYTDKMKNVREEAETIIQDAKKNAGNRYDEIVNDAQNKASSMMEKAQKTIEHEKEQAFKEVQSDITGLAVTMAEKLVENELDENTQKVMMEKIINEMGENDE